LFPGRSHRGLRLRCSMRILFLVLPSFIILQTGFADEAHGKAPSIAIIAPRELLGNSVTSTAIEDTVRLLRQGFPESRVTLGDHSAEVVLLLPQLSSRQNTTPRFARGRNYPYLAYPDHDYQWRSTGGKGRIRLTLRATSPQGVSFALYGLLQEKLGYSFYHPRRTLLPDHKAWPLPACFLWRAAPRFDKKGFHLHTLHPMELTEQLLDPAYPHALADVKEYVDWLVRNGQNVVQFYLLRDIDRAKWIDHAGAVCDYAHRRGVLMGVEISVAMLQQQAFQAVKLLHPYPSYRRQVDRNLAWLFRAKWDFVTVEPTMGEHLPDLGRLRPVITTYLLREITHRYHAGAMLATHVIRPAKERQSEGPGPEQALDPDCGILLHTVMCYSVTDPKAPVYGNINQRFMLVRAQRETLRRETWYEPESSYWVAFDSSVPLFLPIYLEARWRDMESMERIGVANHLTFSSGWEWGYWLIDWSIARWSWRYTENGHIVGTDPIDRLRNLFPGREMERLWRRALMLQEHYLKEHELMKYMACLTPFSELPGPFRIPFQPEPDITSERLLHVATAAEVEDFRRGPLAGLDEYAVKMDELCDRLAGESRPMFAGSHGEAAERGQLAEELIRGLRVTALRARHRSLILQALLAKRNPRPSGIDDPEALLAEASAVRGQALGLVRVQETVYRYPLELIAAKRKDHTAYGFGYLYPVTDLFFWRREEEQVRHERFDPFFMKIWNFRRIVGLESMLF